MNDHFAIDHIVGASDWTDRIRKRILQIANYRYSVLITGPTGTGKELVARAVHVHGPRSEQPFIPVNCAAVPGGLFSSQLFGHVKGAFTGAQHAAMGCFRAADGGTIFLDEIGELDLECQAKLLRVLQERRVTPVGSHDSHPVDVRVIAATNRNLEEEVQAGRFRLDLYYRLNVLSINTLGLHDRTDDIAPLAKHFLAKTAIESGLPLKRLSDEALELLKSYKWPGNVRELQNLIEQAVVFSEGDVIEAEAFQSLVDAGDELFGLPSAGSRTMDSPRNLEQPNRGQPAQEKPAPTAPQSESFGPSDDEPDYGEWPTLAEIERNHIRKTLQETFYNQSAAARLLDIDRKLLARKIKKYNISIPDTRRKSQSVASR